MLLKDYVDALLKEGRAEEAEGLLADLLRAKKQQLHDAETLEPDGAECAPDSVEIPCRLIEASGHAPEICVADESVDVLHYILGNIYYKKGEWKNAIQHYLEACEHNPDSPAQQKLKMAYSILEFYNKDIYGQ